MKVGQWTRLFLVIGGCLMLWGVPGEIGARSKGSDSWSDETSFMALQLRAIGGLKLGLGVGLIGLSLVGAGNGSLREDIDSKMNYLAEMQLAKNAQNRSQKAVEKKVVYPPHHSSSAG